MFCSYDAQNPTIDPTGISETTECHGLNVSEFVYHVALYSGAGLFSFVAALVYLDRYRCAAPETAFTLKSMRRLLLVAVMTAEKYYEDHNYNNAQWCGADPRALQTLMPHIFVNYPS